MAILTDASDLRADNTHDHYWQKFNGTFQTGRNYIDSLSRGAGDVSPNQGNYTYTWTLPLPEGRRSMQPNLSLIYSSDWKLDDPGGRIFGHGWRLSVPYIEMVESIDGQAPGHWIFHDEDGSVHPLTMVYSTSSEKRYRFLRESSFSIVRFFASGEEWMVMRRNGVKLYFDSSGRIYKKEDSTGNYVSYTYTYDVNNCGNMVPSLVEYTMHPQEMTEAPVKVEFICSSIWEPGGLSPENIQFWGPVPKEIRVSVKQEEGQVYLQRRSVFFDFGEEEYHRKLEKIKHWAYPLDGGDIETLPDMEFEYSTPGYGGYGYVDAGNQPGAAPEYAVSTYNGNWLTHTLRTFADMNGDGIRDLVVSNESTGKYDIYFGEILQDGSYWTSSTVGHWDFPGSSSSDVYGDVRCIKTQFRQPNAPWWTMTLQDLIDMNGDGRADWVVSLGGSGIKVALNNGTGFDAVSPMEGMECGIRNIWNTVEYNEVLYECTTDALMDVNGDGYLECHQEYGGCIERRAQDTTAPEGNPNYGKIYTLEETIDMDGDGYLDKVVQPCQEPDNHQWTWQEILVNGHGWGISWPLGISRISPVEGEGITHKEEWSNGLLMDYNGDGLADFLRYRSNEDDWVMYRNTGSSLHGNGVVASSEDSFGYTYTEINHPSENTIHTEILYMDMDGDGVPDCISGYMTGDGISVYLSNDRPGFLLLTKVTNSFGGETCIDYKSIRLTEDSSGNNPLIPVGKAVVTKVTNEDKVTGKLREVDYEYWDGYFESAETGYDSCPECNQGWPGDYLPGNREFRGFAKVYVYEDSPVHERTYWYHQSLYGNGKTLEAKNGTATNTFSHHDYVSIQPEGAAPVEGWPGPIYMPVSKTTTTVSDGQTSTKTARAFQHDDLTGLLLEETDRGVCVDPFCEDDGIGTRKTVYTVKKSLNYDIDRWITARKTKLVYQKQYLQREGVFVLEEKEHYYHDSPSLIFYITQGLLTKVQRYNSSTSGDYGYSLRTYDSLGLLATETDFDQQDPVVTYYTRDPVHKQYVTSKIIGELAEQYEWDYGLGQKTLITDPNGVQTKSYYDAFGRLVSEYWSPDGDDWEWLRGNRYFDFEYLQSGDPVYEANYANTGGTTELTAKTYRFYDGFGRVLQISRNHDGQDGIVRTLDYDLAGRLVKVSVPEKKPEAEAFVYQGPFAAEHFGEYAWDILDRVTGVREACSSAWRTFSYGGDLSLEMQDEEGNKLKTYADGWGNISSIVRDPDGVAETTVFDYNSKNQIWKITDPLQNEITYGHSFLGKITRVTYPGEQQWELEYDNNGLLIHSLSPEGREIGYEYDEHQRVTRRSFEIDSQPDGEVIYTYDDEYQPYGLGRLFQASSEAGLVTYEYDGLGRVTYRAFDAAASGEHYTLKFVYYPGGQIETVTYPDVKIYAYEYLPDGSPKLLKALNGRWWETVAEATAYDEHGKITAMDVGDNLHYAYERDLCGRPLRMTSSAKSTIMDRELIYLQNGKIGQTVDHELSRTQNYVYDGLMRLSAWKDDSMQDLESYGFSSGGNPDTRLRRVEGDMSNVSLNYADPSFPWAVTSITDNITRSLRSFTYDDDGLLTQETVGSITKHFNYDARTLMRGASTPGNNRSWLYDHEDMPARLEVTSPGPQHTYTDLVGKYFERTWYPLYGEYYRNLYFAGQRIARSVVGGDTTYYHADERGSVRYVTYGSGKLFSSFSYTPYGNEYEESGSSEFKFNARRDEGFGMLRFPLRMLDKTAYHWKTLDPKALSPGVWMSDGPNPYAYCGYDPVNVVDENGGSRIDINKALMRARREIYGPRPLPIVKVATCALKSEAEHEIMQLMDESWFFRAAFTDLDEDPDRTYVINPHEDEEEGTQTKKRLLRQIYDLNILWGGEYTFKENLFHEIVSIWHYGYILMRRIIKGELVDPDAQDSHDFAIDVGQFLFNRTQKRKYHENAPLSPYGGNPLLRQAARWMSW